MAIQSLIIQDKYSIKSVIYSLVLSAFMALSGCGGGGGGGGSSTTPPDTNITLNDPVSNGGTISIGSTPVTANAGTHSFSVSGLTVGSLYIVWVHDLSSDVSLTTYVDSAHSISGCTSNNTGTNPEECTAVSADGKVYFTVTSAANTTFIVTVRPLPQSEGTQASPVALSPGTPYNGQIGTSKSYYVLNGLTPGAVYNITLNSILIEADLTVSIHKSLYTSCTSSNAGTTAESCSVPANFQGKIYIQVDNNSFGAYFTLTATATGATDEFFEGYSDEPIDLTGKLPYSGQVNYHDSYYMFTGLTPGVRYEVRVNNPTVNTQIVLFDTSDFVNPDCDLNYGGNPLPASRLCVATAPADGKLYLHIPYYLTTGGTYQLDIGLAPVAEGTSVAPKQINLSSPYYGQVDNTSSYYVLTGLTPNYVYDISFSDKTQQNLYFFVATSTGSLIDSSCGPPCTIRSNSNGEIYIRANGTSTGVFGSWFTLSLGNAENSEGTAASPVVIPSNGSVYAGQVTELPSYYKATGLTPNQYYLIYLTSDMYSAPFLYAFASNTYSPGICSTSTHKACLAPANANGEIFFIVNYNSVSGARFNMWINPSLITSEGSLASPIPVSLNTNRASKVSSYNTNNRSYYVASGLSASTNYTVSLSNLTDDAYVEVFSDAAMTTNLCTSSRKGLDNETCVATTASGGGSKSLYIRVSLDTRTPFDGLWDGANYTLNISQGGTVIVSQGASGTPIDITSSMPYAGMVRKGANSYYKITGLNPATYYAVMLNYVKGNMGLRVLGDVNFTLTNYLCVSGNTSDFSEHCSTVPNGSGEMYILVEGNIYSDSTFTLNLGAAPVFEGSQLSPLDISANLPYSGQSGFYNSNNDATTKSYYKVSGLLPNTQYLVTTSDTTQNAYTFITGSDWCFNNGWAPAESCVVTSNSIGEITMYVRAYDSAFFTLNVQPAPVSEGTEVSPVTLSLRTPYQGSRGSTDSFYKVTGLVPFSSHRITLTAQDDDQWIQVYTGSDYYHEVCYSGTDNHDVACGASANAAGEIYFKTGDGPSNYTLYVP